MKSFPCYLGYTFSSFFYNIFNGSTSSPIVDMLNQRIHLCISRTRKMMMKKDRIDADNNNKMLYTSTSPHLLCVWSVMVRCGSVMIHVSCTRHEDDEDDDDDFNSVTWKIWCELTELPGHFHAKCSAHPAAPQYCVRNFRRHSDFHPFSHYIRFTVVSQKQS